MAVAKLVANVNRGAPHGGIRSRLVTADHWSEASCSANSTWLFSAIVRFVTESNTTLVSAEMTLNSGRGVGALLKVVADLFGDPW